MDLKAKTLNYIDYSSSTMCLEELALFIKKSLLKEGYILVKNFKINTNDIRECHKKFIAISELVGQPIGHDVNGKIIWDIKSNPKSGSFVKTYSEHCHEAELHTDSQYSFYPEDFFGLLTLKKAKCGGGVSYLLKLDDVLSELRKKENGFKIEYILKNTDYPFIVPNVFKKSDEEVEFNYGPILRNNEIRFRVDTFEKALKFKKDKYTKEQIQAYETLKGVILNNSKTKTFYLEEKDLIFINNKTMLHGRSMFTDSDRHLLRIRMNKK